MTARLCAALITTGMLLPGLLTGTAKADVYDDAYLETLTHFGVPYSDSASAVEMGHAVCAAFDRGASLVAVVLTIVNATEGIYSAEDGAHIAGASIGAYCMWHSDLVQTPGRTFVAGGVGKALR